MKLTLKILANWPGAVIGYVGQRYDVSLHWFPVFVIIAALATSLQFYIIDEVI